jgi:CHAT domain-containing protein
MPYLHHVAQEVEETVSAAKDIGASSSTDAGAASKTELLAMLSSANMVHLACHGIQHTIDPHQSRFCLTTGDLSVSELMDMNLEHAFFAFLSACETARGDEKNTDEVVHLAAAMLFVGFKSVIATVWCENHYDEPRTRSD